MPAERERLAHIDKMVNLLDEDRPVYPPPLVVLRSFLTEVQWLKAELLAAQERHEEFKRVAMKEAELAQERDEHREAMFLDLKEDFERREKAPREALERIVSLTVIQRKPGTQAAREIAAEALAGSPSEKPGSEQKQETLSTSDYTTTMATGAGVREDLSEKPGSALLESAQGLSDPGMADAD
ncbi:MAG TPA: hypothetical protein VNH41_07120 [Steroidobacteraceae bacterium]|nr:hypothetical protein [Steroidobacteraceae bacterium]